MKGLSPFLHRRAEHGPRSRVLFPLPRSLHAPSDLNRGHFIPSRRGLLCGSLEENPAEGRSRGCTRTTTNYNYLYINSLRHSTECDFRSPG